MLLRLNRLFIPEVNSLRGAIEANKAATATARCEKKDAKEEATATGMPVVLPL